MIINNAFNTMLESPMRQFVGRVELYEGSTLTQMCGCHDSLKSFTIERLGGDGFFGYGICQKINIKLIDTKREIEVSTANYVEAVLGTGSDYIYAFPRFNVTQVRRDENTNEISITAYDDLYKAADYTVKDLGLNFSYTIEEFATACATLLGVPLVIDAAALPAFGTIYEGGANFDGAETIRAALDAVAQATQTIYFINNQWQLVFKRLDKDGEAVTEINRNKYFTLDSGNNRRLTKIAHITELGDNISASLDISGSTQNIIENPFWELRNDIDELVTAALDATGGLTINQFECDWRGNFLIEIGDKIALVTKDGEKLHSYLLNDTVEFNGAYRQRTEWKYSQDDAEQTENPVSLGDALRQTYARVDKANKNIELMAKDISTTTEAISSLRLTTDEITASVTKLSSTTEETLSTINGEMETLSQSVNAKMSAEDVTLKIQEELSNGVESVVTSTGFTFNKDGLTVSKSGSEMTTQITEDGMLVYRDNTTVLTANNEGVQAEDLHATTYLIIGENSRFEDYGSRTGCFWIGG